MTTGTTRLPPLCFVAGRTYGATITPGKRTQTQGSQGWEGYIHGGVVGGDGGAQAGAAAGAPGGVQVGAGAPNVGAGGIAAGVAQAGAAGASGWAPSVAP